MTWQAPKWSSERSDKAKSLWIQGYSASEIADILGGGLSRNAVIGRLHRMKITAEARRPTMPGARSKPATPPKAKRAPPAAKASKPPATPKPLRIAPVEPAPVGGMVIGDLRHFHCRHPINSWPRGYGEWARFCGEFAPEGSYCPHHTALNSGGKPEPKPKPAADFAPRRAA